MRRQIPLGNLYVWENLIYERLCQPALCQRVDYDLNSIALKEKPCLLIDINYTIVLN